MKITHLCLCGPVTDNLSYQENLLPKYHKQLGYEVSVITSKYIWNKNGVLDRDSRSIYYNEYGIKTIRLEMRSNSSIQSRFKRYKNLYESILKEKPDILFVHGVQFLDIEEIVKYLKYNPEVKVYVDNHADFSNSATNWLSKNILHKLIWRHFAQKIEPYVEKFYGVLPARVDFLVNIYKLPKNKIDLLVMGADDEKVEEANNDFVRKEIRNKYNIKSDDFLIITGGKIDNAKRQTLLLMKAVKEMKQNNVKLLVFGSVIDELKEEVNKLIDGKKIQYIGWINSNDCYRFFAASNLAVFPGRHSVLWEQAAGSGIPLIVKYWEGTNHIDVGGNCLFLYNDSVDEIKSKISRLINEPNLYKKMEEVAKSNGVKIFSYKEIAKRSLS
jgi:1,2-diacylglycerol 3-alpha-glucosyltransferase